jgi:four helix bundle protein
MTPEELKGRTTSFALRVLKLYRSLPPCPEGRVIGSQLLRSSTSVAANYRAVCRARSRPEFLFKLGIVEEEADESVFWLEFLVDSGLVTKQKMVNLISEAKQLTAIFVASRRTAKKNNRQLAIGNRKSRRFS